MALLDPEPGKLCHRQAKGSVADRVSMNGRPVPPDALREDLVSLLGSRKVLHTLSGLGVRPGRQPLPLRAPSGRDRRGRGRCAADFPVRIHRLEGMPPVSQVRDRFAGPVTEVPLPSGGHTGWEAERAVVVGRRHTRWPKPMLGAMLQA